jgi:hypothetical protein
MVESAFRKFPALPRELRGKATAQSEIQNRVDNLGGLKKLRETKFKDPWGGQYEIAVDLNAGPEDPADQLPVGQIVMRTSGPSSKKGVTGREYRYTLVWTAAEPMEPAAVRPPAPVALDGSVDSSQVPESVVRQQRELEILRQQNAMERTTEPQQ